MLREAGVRTDKSLGQHFIFDMNLTDKIARAVPGLSDTNIIEIGPGPGGLTRSLLRCGAKSLIVVERDERMIGILENIRLTTIPPTKIGEADFDSPARGELTPTIYPRLRGDDDNKNAGMTIINNDAMRLGREFYESVSAPRAIVSNLPYNVGTELLIGWLHNMDLFESLTLMFQKEVAERIVARPGSKHYGRLSVLVALNANARILFNVPRTAFNPPPKVESAVVQLTPHLSGGAGQPAPLGRQEKICVEEIVAKLFANRRKMIRSALPGFDWASVGLVGTERAEELSVEKFVEISQKI
ncbi:MAG: 16S rRNA (adenine(1518)-N(6)/adenine(1519)-N(6))-dimethyltransferase [Rickettsiales bacterium]|nr:16S rRNA (adenine(1518)-N(6)/adenine(1519)-N(6))-dimethyltransferase [Rickettsiales bacterium]